MRYITRLRTLAGGLTLGAVLLLGVTTVNAAPSAEQKEDLSKLKPPATSLVSGKQDKPALEPGKHSAKQSESLGRTEQAKLDANGKPQTSDFTTQAGAIANVDLATPLNYCWKDFVYTPVKNTSAATRYVKLEIYNQGTWRYQYYSVPANSTIYPSFYGLTGAYTVYQYVWNGSYYQYDEYLTNNNTCNVSVTRTYNTAGWVQLKIQNLGTAYATQQSSELAPFPGSGTYTGTHYDYPAAGGAAIYRWFWVGSSPYGIMSHTLNNSTMNPYLFTGDL